MTETEKPKRFVCPHCSRAYRKSEHLIRHKRTHTGAKPFACAVCHRKFARHDSLLRHQKLHSRDQAENNGNPVAYDPVPPQLHVQSTLPLDFDESSIQQDLESGIGGGPNNLLNTIESDVGLAENPFDIATQLNWSGSEDLLQSILAAEIATWPPSLTVPATATGTRNAHSADLLVHERPSIDQNVGSSNAIHDLGELITSHSTDVVSETRSLGITTVFLDDCLHMFWTRCVSVFPVVHAPTFVYHDWTHPLLLNAIALGSLYTEKSEDLARGEALWKLAHTAVATSWHSMIRHQGPHDARQGVQLVLTALLGQAYAMLSRNPMLRKTAQVFHSLGFFWGRETGIYDLDAAQQLDEPNDGDTPDELSNKWRAWAAIEVQKRAILGHYVLDGHIAQYTGGPTSERHTLNTTPLPCCHDLFKAGTAEEWFSVYKVAPRPSKSSNDIFHICFSPHLFIRSIEEYATCLGLFVILEGINSLLMDFHLCKGPVVGRPTKMEVLHALTKVYQLISSNPRLVPEEESHLKIRWHTICIDAVVDIRQICRKTIHQTDDSRALFRLPGKALSLDIRSWASSSGAKAAFLHARAIHKEISSLPFASLRSMHIPMALCVSAAVYVSFLQANRLPSVPTRISNWDEILMFDHDGVEVNAPSQYLGSSPNVTVSATELRAGVALVSMGLKSLSTTYGIAHELLQGIEQSMDRLGTS